MVVVVQELNAPGPILYESSQLVVDHESGYVHSKRPNVERLTTSRHLAITWP